MDSCRVRRCLSFSSLILRRPRCAISATGHRGSFRWFSVDMSGSVWLLLPRYFYQDPTRVFFLAIGGLRTRVNFCQCVASRGRATSWVFCAKIEPRNRFVSS
jgi:hypothetical protein